MDARAKELIQIGDGLFSKRADLHSLWQEIAENFYPERATFTVNRSMGDEFSDHLMTSYPPMARQELGNTLSAYLRPRSQPWFKLSAKDEQTNEDDAAAEWLESRSKVLWNILYDPLSGFVRATKEADHDYATFGQAVISVEPNRDMDGLLFRSWHLKDVAWTESYAGRPDTVHRKWKPSARAMARMFPKTVSEITRRCAEMDPQKEIDCRHIVVPANEYDMPKARLKGAKYVSVYIDIAGETILEERARPEMGYVIPRWKTLSGSQYAFSPCTSMMLPDARLIQSVTRVLLEAGEKAVDPPMLAYRESLRSDLALYAGGVTFVDLDYDERTGDPLRPLTQPQTTNLAYGLDVARDLRGLIDRGFFLDQLRLPDSRSMTAYEVRERIKEYIVRLSPLFEPIEEEYSAPLLDEALQLTIRMGGLGPANEVPEALRGGADLEFAFESPLRDNQEQIKGQQFIQLVETTGAAMQFDPTVVRNVRWREAHRDAIRGSGLPADWLASEQEVEQMLEGERRQKAAQEAAQVADMGASIAGNVGDAAVKLRQGGLL